MEYLILLHALFCIGGILALPTDFSRKEIAPDNLPSSLPLFKRLLMALNSYNKNADQAYFKNNVDINTWSGEKRINQLNSAVNMLEKLNRQREAMLGLEAPGGNYKNVKKVSEVPQEFNREIYELDKGKSKFDIMECVKHSGCHLLSESKFSQCIIKRCFQDHVEGYEQLSISSENRSDGETDTDENESSEEKQDNTEEITSQNKDHDLKINIIKCLEESGCGDKSGINRHNCIRHRCGIGKNERLIDNQNINPGHDKDKFYKNDFGVTKERHGLFDGLLRCMNTNGCDQLPSSERQRCIFRRCHQDIPELNLQKQDPEELQYDDISDNLESNADKSEEFYRKKYELFKEKRGVHHGIIKCIDYSGCGKLTDMDRHKCIIRRCNRSID